LIVFAILQICFNNLVTSSSNSISPDFKLSILLKVLMCRNKSFCLFLFLFKKNLLLIMKDLKFLIFMVFRWMITLSTYNQSNYFHKDFVW